MGNNQSFLQAEANLKKGARGRLIREIPFFIKVLLVDEGVLPSNQILMEE